MQPPAKPADDGILAALRRFFTPTPDAPPPTPVHQTPFADTVFALGGRPRTIDVHGLGYDPLTAAKVEGRYTYPTDRMELDKTVTGTPADRPIDVGEATPRHVLMHEEAHRLDPTNPFRVVPSQDPGYRQAFDAYRRNHPTTSAPRKDTYAATSKAEHFAEAMADAVELLQQTAGAYKDLPPGSRNTFKADPTNAAGAVDVWAGGRTPGADTLAIELLKRPIYAQHPLASAARNKAVYTDPRDQPVRRLTSRVDEGPAEMRPLPRKRP